MWRPNKVQDVTSQKRETDGLLFFCKEAVRLVKFVQIGVKIIKAHYNGLTYPHLQSQLYHMRKGQLHEYKPFMKEKMFDRIKLKVICAFWSVTR